MKNLRTELSEIINRFSPTDGLHETPVPGVYCVKRSYPDIRTKRHWRACWAIFAQGTKEIVVGRDVFRFKALDYTAAPIDLPVVSRIADASPEKPFLALLVRLNPLTLSEVAAQFDKEAAKEVVDSHRGFFAGKTNDKMQEASLRLAKLFEVPKDAAVLGPLIIKEILYHLLKGSEGPALRQFARSGSKMHKVSQAIYFLQADLSQAIDVEALAKTASMSRSAFFTSFKEATSMSPIQFQKRLRLLEARRLMLDEGGTAEGAAFKVGYESPSQFSREYSRMFGSSPLRNTAKIKKTGRPLQEV